MRFNRFSKFSSIWNAKSQIFTKKTKKNVDIKERTQLKSYITLKIRKRNSQLHLHSTIFLVGTLVSKYI